MTPETAKGWLSTIYPILVQAGPALSLMLLLLGAVQVWYLLGQVSRTQDMNARLYGELMAAKDKHLALVERQYDLHRICAPRSPDTNPQP